MDHAELAIATANLNEKIYKSRRHGRGMLSWARQDDVEIVLAELQRSRILLGRMGAEWAAGTVAKAIRDESIADARDALNDPRMRQGDDDARLNAEALVSALLRDLGAAEVADAWDRIRTDDEE